MTLRCFCAALSLACVCAVTGCESPNGLHGLESSKPFWSRTNSHDEEVQYRKDYQTNRSRKAMRWLLANRVDSGMSVNDVNTILGEKGELDESPSANSLKRGNTYRIDDKVFHYGPDSGGRAVYLVFRDDKLVNFERQRFSDSERVNPME